MGAENTKGDYHIISGRINDIAWDGDSQRIIAVGDGRERFGHCVTADSGNSVGEISGHSKVINSVSIRQQRPLRAATGSDDASLVFLNGAPFKFANKFSDCHTGYVYGVAFSPDGEHLVSVGADKKIQLYDGKTGEPTTDIGEGVHTGSIFAVSWAPDSKQFVTASADQTVRIWNAVTGENTATWRFPAEDCGVSIKDHQVGVCWPAGRTDGLIISINLLGDLNYLYPGEKQPRQIVHGHNRSITAAGYTADKVLTGSFEGRICAWDITTGTGTAVDGSTHTNQVIGFTTTANASRAYSVGWDDTLRVIDPATSTFLGHSVKLSAQPKGIAITDDSLYVATGTGIDIFDAAENMLVSSFDTPSFEPQAIGGFGQYVCISDDSGNLHVFEAKNTERYRTLVPHTILHPSPSPITTLRFSPRGTYLALGTHQGKIQVFETKSWSLVTDRFSAHTAKIMALDWNEEETHIVSGSLDTNVHVWSLAKPGARVKAPNAHKEGVNGVVWTKEGKVVSTGGDGAVKVWSIQI